MSHNYPTHLPELVPAGRADQLITAETVILDLAEALIAQGDDSLAVHTTAIALAREIDAATRDNAGDPDAICFAAEQLKLYHLDLLQRSFTLAGTPAPI